MSADRRSQTAATAESAITDAVLFNHTPTPRSRFDRIVPELRSPDAGPGPADGGAIRGRQSRRPPGAGPRGPQEQPLSGSRARIPRRARARSPADGEGALSPGCDSLQPARARGSAPAARSGAVGNGRRSQCELLSGPPGPDARQPRFSPPESDAGGVQPAV